MKTLFKALCTVALVFCIGALYSSCKSGDGGTGPGAGGGGGGTGEFITIPLPGGEWITIPTLGLTNLKGFLLTTTDQGLPPEAFAIFFGTSTSQFVYAGTVSVNSNTLDTLTFSGQVFYVRPNPFNPQPLVGVNFDGSSHDWIVAGSASIPAFNGSVISPNGVPSITSPADGDTVTRSQGLTITWSGSGTDSVFISVSDGLGNELVAVTGGNAYSFTATQMGTLVAGMGYINISRFKYSIVSAGGSSFIIAAATGDEVSVNFD